MGRRPNALIADFFQRGKKLNDNSNRYEHQCTKCGELFRKGRIDGMLTHLLRKCPQLTQVERDAICEQTQLNANRNTTTTVRGGQTQQSAHNDGMQVSDSTLQYDFDMQMGDLPATQLGFTGLPDDRVQHFSATNTHLQGQQSALDTLAEVSRRHLDFSQHRHVQEYEPNVTVESERQIVQQLMNAMNHTPAGNNEVRHNAVDSSTPGFPVYQESIDITMPHHDSAVAVALPMVQAAVTTTQQLEQNESSDSSHNVVDPQLHALSAQLDQGTGCSGQEASETLPFARQPQPFVTRQVPTTSDPVPRLGNLLKPDKHRRTRFDDDRRKEVQETRKRGACIRCRMLKKPCSDGTPCQKCAHIDTARLWKGACVRTKLADELTFYSASYFRIRADVEISIVQQGLTGPRIYGRLQLNPVPDQRGPDASFRGYMHQVSNARQINHDPLTMREDASREDLHLLDESEDLVEKLSQYYTQELVRATYTLSEPNDLLRAALIEAQSLCDEEAKRERLEDRKSDTRTNQIQPSQLLKQVIELWVLTNVLVSSSDLAPKMTLRFECSTRPEEQLQQPSARLYVAEIRPESQSYRLIQSQILAAIETRCRQVCKSVLNELERRLLQRQQVSAFATFISAVALLNCVERMTAMYQTLTSQTNLVLPFWSSENPSLDQMIEQGPSFAALLTMLLRVRALPPATTSETADGRLAVLLPSQTSKPNGPKQREEMSTRAQQWLDACNLNVRDLIARRDTPGRIEDGWHRWDMRLVAAVLLPERS